MSKPLGGDELLAAVMRWEGRLDELMADVGEAAEIYGTDSPEHLAAIDAFDQHSESYATAFWADQAGPEAEPAPEPEVEPEAEP